MKNWAVERFVREASLRNPIPRNSGRWVLIQSTQVWASLHGNLLRKSPRRVDCLYCHELTRNLRRSNEIPKGSLTTKFHFKVERYTRPRFYMSHFCLDLGAYLSFGNPTEWTFSFKYSCSKSLKPTLHFT